jgi:hypothetical protein
MRINLHLHSLDDLEHVDRQAKKIIKNIKNNFFKLIFMYFDKYDLNKPLTALRSKEIIIPYFVSLHKLIYSCPT